MFDNLTARLSPHHRRPARPRAHHRGQRRRDPARGARGAARSGRRAAGGQDVHRRGQGQGARRRGRLAASPRARPSSASCTRSSWQLMGGARAGFNLRAQPPIVVLLAGLQGAGKTTTAAKLARWLIERDKKRVLLVSTDVRRPAAMLQLERLAEQVQCGVFPGAGERGAGGHRARGAGTGPDGRVRRADRRYRRTPARR